MNKTQEQKIKSYMRSCWNEHIDSTCNVLNTTSLAEDAISHFDGINVTINSDDEDLFFDYAVDIDRELYKKGLVNQ